MSFKRGNNENDETNQGPPAKVPALDEDEFLLEDVDEQMAEEMLIDIANQFEDSLETSQDEGFEDNVPEVEEESNRDILEDDLALEDSDDDDDSDEEVENVQEVEENPDEESEEDSDDEDVDFSADSLESSSESDEDDSSEGNLKKYTRRWIKEKIRNDSKHAITVMDMNYPKDDGMPATVRLLNFGMILFQTEQGFVRTTWKGRFVLDEEHEQMRYSVRPFQISLITLTQITDAKLYMDFWCWNDQRSMRLIAHNDRTCRWLRRFLEDLETFRRIGNFTMFLGPSDERVINESYQTANRSVPEFYGNVDGAQAKDVAFPFHSKTMFKAVRLLSELYPER